ncbi:MAG: bile acid:sodium symporter family protein [Deltaproteobacteria bacterium]
MSSINSAVTSYFTFWIIILSVVAYLAPAPLAGLTYLIVPVLGIIMFGMGMTLTAGDFKRILESPKDVAVGVAAQYGIMPFLGFALAEIFGLGSVLAAGVVLVGSCPGGTASNVITYLAKGDLALSVTMTSVSTLLSPLMIPFLMYVYAGQWIDVPVLQLFVSTLQIIILPVALGLGIRTVLGDRIRYALPVMPAVSSVSIIFIVAVIVAANAGSIAEVGLSIGAVVILHNTLGLSIGYFGARIFGMDKTRARAVSIEVGMQNSGLAVALANAHFGALTALPGAVFSVWANISGSALAWWWRRNISNAGD